MIGNIERVKLRDVWKHEAFDLTTTRIVASKGNCHFFDLVLYINFNKTLIKLIHEKLNLQHS